MIVQGFVGPSNYLRAENADAERTINWFPAGVAPGTGKVATYLAPAPGLVTIQNLEDPANVVSQAQIEQGLYRAQIGVGRGIFTINGRTWVVTGGAFWEIDILGDVYKIYGLVAGSMGFVPMCSNGSAGRQVMLTAGGFGYIFNLGTNTLTQIPITGFFPQAAGMCEFVDGYFIVVDGYNTSRGFAISKLEDGLTWSGVGPEAYQRSMASDNIVGICRVRRELWIFGNRTTEVWVDVGTVNNKFQPLQNTLIEMGCSAAWSIQRVDNGVMWVGPNENGNVGVWLATGYAPARVSTDAIDYYLNAFVDASPDNSTNIRAWTYRQDGHSFYVVMANGVTSQNVRSELAFVYDLTTNMWCERGRWDPATATFASYPAAGHVTIGPNTQHVVLDHQSPRIFGLGREAFANVSPAGADPIRRLRRFTLPFDEHKMVTISRLELLLRTGIGLANALPPQVMFRFSRDGGLTWGNERWVSAGALGNALTRVIVTRLGQGRNWMGEITVADPVYWALLEVTVDATVGTA